MYKFERLEVYQLALEYLDMVYDLAAHLPRSEEFNLKPQIIRAATSITLNVAEGSTGQTDAEQGRFLAMAIRSFIETVACLHIIRRRNYVQDAMLLTTIETKGQTLARKLQAMRKAVLKEEAVDYDVETAL